MTIIFLAHPSFLGSQSMPRYARYLLTGMAERGHRTELWQPQPSVYNWSAPQRLKKWLGYVDQYVVFPQEIKQRIRRLPKDALLVLTDHALGPYVPLIVNRPHLIHCHDFLAQRSALGKLPENSTSWTGKQYQAFIRKGFSQGKNFISVSASTQCDLHHILGHKPSLSEVVHNSLLDSFTPANNVSTLRLKLQHELSIELSGGFLLHIGGNDWYKNREGVIRIYDAWRMSSANLLPLLLVGPAPSESLLSWYRQSSAKKEIHFLTSASDSLVKELYQAALVLLFPSLAEGFGWPIIEAMASGCPVITTDACPMSDVAGESAFLIPRLSNECDANKWAADAAKVVHLIQCFSAVERNAVIASGLLNVQRFRSEIQLNKIEKIYESIVNSFS